MRIMGLDVGTKTVGVAISDAFGWTAQGIETVKINEELGEFGIERIKELVKEYAVSEFVVGFPKNMNNTVGPLGIAAVANFVGLIAMTCITTAVAETMFNMVNFGSTDAHVSLMALMAAMIASIG